MNLWFLEFIIYTINTTYSSPHSLFHWMFRCNVSHLPPATHNKRNYLGMGDTKKHVFFEGQTQSRSPKTLPPHPQVSGGLVSPQIQSRSPKAVYFFVFFLESRYLFFLLSRLNPKQLTQNVDMLRGEPRIWIYYVCGYTQTLGTPIANKWSWFWEILYPLQNGPNMFQRIVFQY